MFHVETKKNVSKKSASNIAQGPTIRNRSSPLSYFDLRNSSHTNYVSTSAKKLTLNNISKVITRSSNHFKIKR